MTQFSMFQVQQCMGYWCSPTQFCQVLLFVYMFLFSNTVYGKIIVDNSSGPEVIGDVGDDVTLVCDLSKVGRDDIYWHVVELGKDISRNQNIIEDSLPESDKGYFSIVGDQSKGEFNLNIKSIQITDTRTYECVYYTGLFSTTKNTLIATKLTVLNAPSSDSPHCNVLPSLAAAGASEDFSVGDTVHLVCSADEGNPIPVPQLSWYRNEDQLLGEGTGYISVEHILELSDNNIVFTCLMTTPALDSVRNCSRVLLRAVDLVVTAPKYTTSPPSLPKIASTKMGKQTSDISTSSVDANMQRLIIVGAAAGAGFLLLMIILAIIITVVCCLMKKKRNKSLPNAINRPATNEYELVTPQNKDSGDAIVQSTEPPDDESPYVVSAVQPPVTQQSSKDDRSPNQDPDGFPVYAQPHGHKATNSNKQDTRSRVNYENVNEDEKQLVYADLELNENAGDDIIQTDDPTLYAKLKV